jgi:hypothetical protein
MAPVKPRFEYVFSATVNFAVRTKLGPLPSGGMRGFVSVGGGTISGPRLTGRVLPHGGADWAHFRPDGTVMIAAHYMFEATDGTLIYVRNNGYRHQSPEVGKRLDALEQVAPEDYYMRLSPTFDTPIGPHDWLTRTVIVGSAERHADHTVFDYYAVM